MGEIWDHPAKFGVSMTYDFGWPDTFRAEEEQYENNWVPAPWVLGPLISKSEL